MGAKIREVKVINPNLKRIGLCRFYQTVFSIPPSTGIVVPVINDALSESKNAPKLPNSSGLP